MPGRSGRAAQNSWPRLKPLRKGFLRGVWGFRGLGFRAYRVLGLGFRVLQDVLEEIGYGF